MNPAEIHGAPHLPQVLGFAGHRTVKHPERLREIILEEIRAHQEIHGCDAVCCSSAAAGADLIFLDAAGLLGCTTWVILPFPEDRFAEDFESPADWERAKSHIHAVAWHGTLKPEPGEALAENAYQFTARRMLRIAGRMLFFWDGQPARGPGGTAETIEDAKRANIPSRIIDADRMEIVAAIQNEP